MSESGVLISDIGWQEEQAHDMKVVNRSAGVTTAGTMLLCDVLQTNAATTNVLFGDLASIWVNVVGLPVAASGWRMQAPAVVAVPGTANVGAAVGQLYTARVHGVIPLAQVANAGAAAQVNSGYALAFPADGALQVAGDFDIQAGSPGAAVRALGMLMSVHTVGAGVESCTIMFRGEPVRR